MKFIKKYFLVFFFSTVLVGCGGGGGGDSTVNPTLPGDATRITSINATTIARTAIDSVFLSSDLTAFRQEPSSPSTAEVVNFVIQESVKKIQPTQSIALRTETQACQDGGAITVSADGNDTSGSGSISFDNCNFGGTIIDGSFSFSASFNNSTGAYDISVSGRLTVDDSFESVTIAMNYRESGNDFDGSFSTSITLSISGTTENFLLTTTQAITGVGFDILSGEVIVEGADGTRLRLVVVESNTVDVYFDNGSGDYVYQDRIYII